MKNQNNDYHVFFKLSLGDLAASRVLYTNGYYRQSFFLFQQASEKANKGYLLLTGESTINELRQSSHAQIGIYKNLTKKKRNYIDNMIKVIEPFQHTHQNEIPFLNFTSYLKTLNNALEGFGELEMKTQNISVDDLTNLTYELKDLEHIPIRRPRNLISIVKKHLTLHADWLKGFETAEIIESEKELRKVIHVRKKLHEISDISFEVGIIQSKLLFSQLTLFVCAMITNKHSTSTRYADTGADPDNIYTKKLPIVRKQLQFMILLKKAIDRILFLDQEMMSEKI